MQDGQRLSFGDPKEAERKLRRQNMLGALKGASNRDDDEMLKWEMQQIQKGTAGAGEENRSLAKLRAETVSDKVQRGGWGDQNSFSGVTVEMVQKELREALCIMQEKHEEDLLELERITRKHDDMEDQLETNVHEKQAASNRYQLFQKMHEYVLDLVDCFDSILVAIEESEDGVRDLRKARNKELRLVQQGYAQDLMRELQELQGTQDPAVLDEFGRDPTEQLREEGRRRREVRQQSRAAKDDQSPEGFSSDEEEESQAGIFDAGCKEMEAKLKEAFEDIVDHMKDLRAIKKTFMEWKQQERSSYKAGHVAASVPSILGPLVRKQLLLWEPLKEPDITKMVWFETLQDYGAVGGPIQYDDEDYNLIPKLVSNTVLPIACDAVEFDWNCWSSTSTKKVVRLWNELTDFLDDKEDSQMAELRDIILDRIHETVQETILPVVGGTSPQIQQHVDRLFWRSLKMLGNVCRLHMVFLAGELQSFVLDRIVEKMYVPYLTKQVENGNAVCVALQCTQIVDQLPKKWLQTDMSAKMLSFVALLENVAHKVSNDQDTHDRISRVIAQIAS